MEVLESPYLMFLLIALTVLSTWLSWRGFKDKDGPAFLLGIGFGIPTFDLTDWHMWLAGGLVCALGFCLKRALD